MNLEENCRQYWKKHGLTNVNTLKEYIESIFNRHDHQEDVLIELYKLMLPEWERILKVIGYPEVGNELWRYVCRLFQEFDHKHHPDSMPGGMWMNTGFSANSKLSPWEVSFRNCHVEYAQSETASTGGA